MARVSAKKREQYMRDRREKILDAATVMFGRNGFASTRMADIATRAGMAKGTVYLYFTSKDEVFSTLLAERSFVPQLAGLIKDEQPVDDTLRGIAESYVDFMETNHPLLRMVIADSFRFPDRMRQVYRDVVLKGCRALAVYLGAREGLDATDTSSRPFLMAFSFLGLMTSYTLSQEILGGKRVAPLPREEWIENVVRLFHASYPETDGRP